MRRRRILRRGAVPALTLTATTAGAGNVTLHRMTPAAGTTLTIDWGDGSTTTVAAGDTANQVHAYAAAGVWRIRVTNARNIVQIDLHDTQLSGLKSAELRDAEISTFVCYSLGAAAAGRFDSADTSMWSPSSFWMASMPAGFITVFDSAHVAGWNPTTFWMYSLPSATATWTISANSFSGFRATINFAMYNNAFNQTIIDALLWGMYQASVAPRTGIGGTINVSGTNAAPSGVFQAAGACPVSVATPGKEVAHELLNDGCAAGFNVWATVTFTP